MTVKKKIGKIMKKIELAEQVEYIKFVKVYIHTFTNLYGVL
jgi:hypothetical protein